MKLPKGWFEIKRLSREGEEIRTAISALTVLYVSEVIINDDKKAVWIYVAEDRSYSTYEKYEDVVDKITEALGELK